MIGAINGPWTDLPAASPMPPSPIGERGFFQVKVSSFAEASHFAGPTSDLSEDKVE